MAVKSWFRKAYRSISDHLTKLLGLIGTGVTTLAAIDPEPIRQAAQTYLPNNWAVKIAAVLFVLVILRGWYTGLKAKQLAASLPPVKP